MESSGLHEILKGVSWDARKVVSLPSSDGEILPVMAKFRVAFDGEWQEDFDTLLEAAAWAQEVSTTGRTTWVVEQRRAWGLLPDRLCAAFPEERREIAEKAWRRASQVPAGT
jgi:hypothetical protein